MASAKDCHEMTSYYTKKFKEKYGVEPNVNRHRARWSWDSVLGGMSKVPAKQLVDYYFSTNSTKRHSLDWFFNNYEKIMSSKQDAEEDRERIKRLNEESKARADAWRAKGKPVITSKE